MAKEREERQRFPVTSTTRTEVELRLDDKQREGIIDCLRRTGRLSIRLEPSGVTQLAGGGQAEIVVVD